jgi:hypothetical protein
MKFTTLREKYSQSKGDVVSSRRIGKMRVTIEKHGSSKFQVNIDGEKLDVYKTQKEAEKSVEVFAKEYR